MEGHGRGKGRGRRWPGRRHWTSPGHQGEGGAHCSVAERGRAPIARRKVGVPWVVVELVVAVQLQVQVQVHQIARRVVDERDALGGCRR